MLLTQILIVCLLISFSKEDFELLILHNNDMQCRLEETAEFGKVFGGMARVSHIVKEARKAAAERKGPPVLYLNAGDTYTDMVWQNPFTKKVAMEFMNVLRPDAACFGCHDLDANLDSIREFMKRAKFPILAANLQFTNATHLQNVVKASTILNVVNKKIGVIGYISPQVHLLKSRNIVHIEDEVEAIRRESEKLKNYGVDLIIALGHSGFSVDKMIAEEVEFVDVVVGGLTNTFLWNGLPPDTENPKGPYPIIITQSTGKKVILMQTYGFTKYIGKLKVTYNKAGNLLSYEGNPIFLDATIPKDSAVTHLLDLYGRTVRNIRQDDEVVGQAIVYMNAENVRNEESNFGNFVVDSWVEYYARNHQGLYWSDVSIAVTNGGSIRKSLNTSKEKPNITKKMLSEALPFRQRLVVVDILGTGLLEILENSVKSNGGTRRGEFLQISGLRVCYDYSQPSGRRVVYVKAFCNHCGYPFYNYVDPNAVYRVIINMFLANGGDGYTTFKSKTLGLEPIAAYDLDVLIDILKNYKNIRPECEERIYYLNDVHKADAITNFSKNFIYLFIFYITSL